MNKILSTGLKIAGGALIAGTGAVIGAGVTVGLMAFSKIDRDEVLNECDSYKNLVEEINSCDNISSTNEADNNEIVNIAGEYHEKRTGYFNIGIAEALGDLTNGWHEMTDDVRDTIIEKKNKLMLKKVKAKTEE